MTLLLPLLFACNEPKKLQGHVVDIFDNPVEGAAVLLEGAGERPLTDEFGVYSMKSVPPGTYEMRAGKKGYIQEATDYVAQKGELEGPTFKLFPKPEETGFYAVRVSEYQKLESAIVKKVG